MTGHSQNDMPPSSIILILTIVALVVTNIISFLKIQNIERDLQKLTEATSTWYFADRRGERITRNLFAYSSTLGAK